MRSVCLDGGASEGSTLRVLTALVLIANRSLSTLQLERPPPDARTTEEGAREKFHSSEHEVRPVRADDGPGADAVSGHSRHPATGRRGKKEGVLCQDTVPSRHGVWNLNQVSRSLSLAFLLSLLRSFLLLLSNFPFYHLFSLNSPGLQHQCLTFWSTAMESDGWRRGERLRENKDRKTTRRY